MLELVNDEACRHLLAHTKSGVLGVAMVLMPLVLRWVISDKDRLDVVVRMSEPEKSRNIEDRKFSAEY